jgi:hypothetical protein
VPIVRNPFGRAERRSSGPSPTAPRIRRVGRKLSDSTIGFDYRSRQRFPPEGCVDPIVTKRCSDPDRGRRRGCSPRTPRSAAASYRPQGSMTGARGRYHHRGLGRVDWSGPDQIRTLLGTRGSIRRADHVCSRLRPAASSVRALPAADPAPRDPSPGVDGADEALGDRLGPRCSDGGPDDLDAFGPKDVVEGTAELGVVVAEQEADLTLSFLQIPGQIPSLSRSSRRGAPAGSSSR